MLKTIIASAIALGLGASVALADNCEAIYPAKAAEGELLTVKFPNDQAKGPAHIVVFASQDSARIGGSANTVRWCKSNRKSDAAEFGIVYGVRFVNGEAQVPVADGDAWIRVKAGDKYFDAFRSEGESEITVGETGGKQ